MHVSELWSLIRLDVYYKIMMLIGLVDAGPVLATWMGDCQQVCELSLCVTSFPPGQLSLAIPPWVDANHAMSARKSCIIYLQHMIF